MGGCRKNQGRLKHITFHPHSMIYHSVRLSCQYDRNRGAVCAGPSGNSRTLWTVFTPREELERWRNDHCGRPSHRKETKRSKPTVEVYSSTLVYRKLIKSFGFYDWLIHAM